MLKRILLVLTGFLLLSSVTFATFSDVPFTHSNYEAINFAQARNIVDGYPHDTFHPDALINRAEFVKMITEAYYRGQANGSKCFSDVGTEWFAKYVCFDKIQDFITGYPDGSFKPANNINFVEAAKILVNATGFVVTPDPHRWYKPYVEKMTSVHAIPISITNFDQQVTRGEVAEMIYRLETDFQNKPSKTYEELILEQMSFGLPVRLKISEIDVDSAVEHVGLTPEGAAGSPENPANTAWFNLGPRPGEAGSSVMMGHVNRLYGAAGVFVDLYKLKPGDKITVQDDKGAVISFAVRESRKYDAAADATDIFISNDGKAHLNLITCSGTWNKRAKQYSQRLVVFADKETE